MISRDLKDILDKDLSEAELLFIFEWQEILAEKGWRRLRHRDLSDKALYTSQFWYDPFPISNIVSIMEFADAVETQMQRDEKLSPPKRLN